MNVKLIDKKFWMKSYYVAFDDNNFLVPCLTLNPPQTKIYKPLEDIMVIQYINIGVLSNVFQKIKPNFLTDSVTFEQNF